MGSRASLGSSGISLAMPKPLMSSCERKKTASLPSPICFGFARAGSDSDQMGPRLLVSSLAGVFIRQAMAPWRRHDALVWAEFHWAGPAGSVAQPKQVLGWLNTVSRTHNCVFYFFMIAWRRGVTCDWWWLRNRVPTLVALGQSQLVSWKISWH